tara:strand:- start:138988 stop:140178 length:1191 start_codon:yes stop_codon:yes gene_type:complete
MDSNRLNQTNIDHRGTQDDPNDSYEFSSLDKLTKIIGYNVTDAKQPVKDFLGIVLRAEWVPVLNDGFTEKDLVNINQDSKGRGAYKCVVRIPEVHSCIPEPKRPALQDPNNKTGEPNFDDFYTLMHDDFFVDRSGYEEQVMPQPGDIVVCDYKYRDVRLGGIIKKVHERCGSAGGVKTAYVSTKNGTKDVYETTAKQGGTKTSTSKEIEPKYVGKLEWQEKLDVIVPRLREKVDRILSGLASDGRFDPGKILLTSTWRDANKQSTFSKRSYAKYSYHIVITEPNDSDYYVPQAYAVDISYPMGKTGSKERILQEEFYEKLGELVRNEGLVWGGNFSKDAVREGKFGQYKKDRIERTGISWDPQHMVMKNLLSSPQKTALKKETIRIYKKLGQVDVK